jgi:glycosyltransferase involved in cell wall biosynthesis
MKTLTVVSAKLNRPDLAEAVEMERRDEIPRVSLYQRYLESDLLDERFMMERVPRWRKALYAIVPKPLDQVLEAYVLRKRYDVVITWAERLGLPFAFLLKLTGSRTPHVTLNSWISGGWKARLLKITHSHISRILLWSSVQRDYAHNVLKIPADRITFIRYFADQNFWRPMPVDTDMICAVGVEMRDYPTLIEAMRGLDIPCHIAAGLNRGILYDTVAAIDRAGELPPNLTVGKKNFGELRDLYARSRFVVIPLRATDTDNGLTCMLESMAMGKAVICSRTTGQVDVLRDGETGIFVPQGDSAALREAIVRLWNDPGLAAEMGRRGREFLLEHHTIEQFVSEVRRVAEEVSGECGKPRPVIEGFGVLK